MNFTFHAMVLFCVSFDSCHLSSLPIRQHIFMPETEQILFSGSKGTWPVYSSSVLLPAQVTGCLDHSVGKHRAEQNVPSFSLFKGILQPMGALNFNKEVPFSKS